MPVYKSKDQRVSDEVIGEYRFILHAMTSGLVESWHKRYGNEDNKSANKTMARFLQESSDFSWAYFERVVATMPANVKSDVIQVQRDMRRVIENLQRNWGVLIAVCNQRENRILLGRLKQADAEATEFYLRYQGYKPKVDSLDQEVLPITYFGSRYEITRYPYTPFPVLCFRYEAFENRRLRINGLAHELGHFIYWNIVPAEMSGELISAHHEIDNQIKAILSPWQRQLPDDKVVQRIHLDWLNWKAELFADIVGALLVGPMYVETSMRLYIEEQFAERGSIYAEDAVHPLPILRPLIALETIDLLSDVYGSQQEEIERLRMDWESYFNQATAPRYRRSDEYDELAEQEFQEQRQKADLARQKTRDIVNLFLTARVWPKEDGGKCGLRELFTFTEYVNEAPSVPSHKDPLLTGKIEALEKVANVLTEMVRGRGATKAEEGKPTMHIPEDDNLLYQTLLNLKLSDEYGTMGCQELVEAPFGWGNFNKIDSWWSCWGRRYYAESVPYGAGAYIEQGN